MRAEIEEDDFDSLCLLASNILTQFSSAIAKYRVSPMVYDCIDMTFVKVSGSKSYPPLSDP